MNKNWKFITAATAQAVDWWWVQCSERRVVLRSEQRFSSFPACMLDASSHGFLPSACFEILKDRRRAPRAA